MTSRREQLEAELARLAEQAPHLYAMTLIRARDGADEDTRRRLNARMTAFAASRQAQASDELRRCVRIINDLAAGKAAAEGALRALLPALTQAAVRHRENAPLPSPPPQRLAHDEELVIHDVRLRLSDLPRLAPDADQEGQARCLRDMEPRTLAAVHFVARLRAASLAGGSGADLREKEALERGASLADRVIRERGIDVPKEFQPPDRKQVRQEKPDKGAEM